MMTRDDHTPKAGADGGVPPDSRDEPHLRRSERLDAETLAALAEGRVPEPERSELLERVADYPADVEVLAETIAILEEESLREEEERARRSIARRLRVAAPVLLAAALAVGIAAALLWWTTPRVPTANELAASLPAGPQLAAAVEQDWQNPVWVVYRSGPEADGIRSLDPEVKAFRLGALHVNMSVALHLQDQTAWERAAEQARQMSVVTIGLGDSFGRMYEAMKTRPLEGERGRQTALALEELEEAARGTLDGEVPAGGACFEAGRLAQAGRLAARADAPEPLRGETYRQAVHQLAESPAPLPEVLRAALERLQEVVKATAATAVELAEACEAVLAAGGGLPSSMVWEAGTPSAPVEEASEEGAGV